MPTVQCLHSIQGKFQKEFDFKLVIFFYALAFCKQVATILTIYALNVKQQT